MRTLRALAAGTALVAGLLGPATLHAQNSKYFGFVGGATLSDFTDWYGAYSTSSKWGGNAGLILGMRTYRRMAVSLEPAWSQMGGQVQGSSAGLDYLEVPLLVGGLAEASDKLRYGGYTGIMPAFKLSCSIDSAIGNCDRVKGTSWFLPLGLRVLTKTGSNSFVGFDIRYSLPLGSSVDNASINQRSWAFRLVFAKGDL